MRIIKNIEGKQLSLTTSEINPEKITKLKGLSLKIINALKSEAMYPRQIAEKIKVNEQNVYYTMRKLEKAGIIKVEEEKAIRGIMAKLYGLASESFFFALSDFKEGQNVSAIEPNFLKPFIKNGELDAIFVIGSPDPHGPQKARSRDGYLGIDLALSIGTSLSRVSKSRVVLDIDLKNSDMEKNNLIVIGGPIVNKVSFLLNKKMPIQFDDKKRGFYSTLSKKWYLDDDTGVIMNVKNPFNKDKQVMLIEGKRYSGTKAAVLAFLKHFKELESGNKYSKKAMCKIVNGIDLDSDGNVDDVEFLE